jgi:hypothetical protein
MNDTTLRLLAYGWEYIAAMAPYVGLSLLAWRLAR